MLRWPTNCSRTDTHIPAPPPQWAPPHARLAILRSSGQMDGVDQKDAWLSGQAAVHGSWCICCAKKAMLTGSSPGSSEEQGQAPGINNLEVMPPLPAFSLPLVDHFFLCAQTLSCVQFFAIPCTMVSQAPLSMGFPRQEYWRGLPFPSPRGLPDSRIEPAFLTSPALLGGFFTTSIIWEATFLSLAMGKFQRWKMN